MRMRNVSIAAALILALACSLPGAASAAGPSLRVGVLEWTAGTAPHLPYITGYDDGSFRPEAAVTRAEAAIQLYRLADEPDIQSDITFSDVPEGAWYYRAVTALAGLGAIGGYDDGTFAPDRAVTRAEFTAMALAALMNGSDTSRTDTGFSDVPPDHWAAGDIALAVENGYITGYPDGTFRPGQSLTRAEAVTILNRFIGCAGIAEGGTFTDVPETHWAYKAITAASTPHEHEGFME